MNKLTINACPLCQHNHLRFAMKCEDHYASGEQFELYECEDCGFIFTQNVPVEEEIGRYYETPGYISHSDTKKGLVNTLYHTVRMYMLGRKARLISRILGKSSGNLLDVGTGTGYFPNAMKQRGWTVEAVEKNEQARQFAKENFKLDIKDPGALTELPAKSFDVITLWHVMEHLENLHETWERFYQLLADDGVLIIAVPNCKSYDASRYGRYWAAYDVPRHLWHFTPNTIQQFGCKHNFILADQYPMPFDAFYVSILSEKYMKSSAAFLKGICSGFIGWFQSLVNKEKSSSIIYVFRKK